MKMEIRTENGVNVAVLIGELDAMHAEDCQARLMQLGKDDASAILLDLEALDMITSAGLRALLEVARDLKARDGVLAFCRPSELVLEILELAYFTKMFAIYSTPDEGVAQMTADRPT